MTDGARAEQDVTTGIAAAARVELARQTEIALRRTGTPWWHTFASGRIYRPAMRLLHHFGWCYPQPSFPDGDVMWWCHWCGLRGRK